MVRRSSQGVARHSPHDVTGSGREQHIVRAAWKLVCSSHCLLQAHFDRWIALFAATARGIFVPELAEQLHETSKRMRMTLGAHLPS